MIAPNINPDAATGIGKWSNEGIIRAIRDGIGKKGRLLNPEMPYRYFRSLDDDEAHSIVVYLRSIPLVRSQLPEMAEYVTCLVVCEPRAPTAKSSRSSPATSPPTEAIP